VLISRRVTARVPEVVLNDRQRTYLLAIFKVDQELEAEMRSLPFCLLVKVMRLIQADQPNDPVRPHLLAGLRDRARILKRDTYTLYLAARHPRTPWYAKMLAAAVVAYALSPFDLIPDFIPVIGYLDDLIIVPIGITPVLG
jgi:hypothetical protein